MSDRCPSCEHGREYHSEPGCWYAVTVGTPDEPLNCPCTIVGWPAPTPVDWPARFRAAADVAEREGLVRSARELRELARRWGKPPLQESIEAIGRALLGEAS